MDAFKVLLWFTLHRHRHGWCPKHNNPVNRLRDAEQVTLGPDAPVACRRARVRAPLSADVPGQPKWTAPGKLAFAGRADALQSRGVSSPLRGVGIKLQGSQAGTGASGIGHARQSHAGKGVSRSVSQAHGGHRCAAVRVLLGGPAACGADARRSKAAVHGQQHGAAAGTRPAMTDHARIGSSACAARSGGPGWSAGAAAVKRHAVPCESLRSMPSTLRKLPTRRADAALACHRRGHQPIICSVSRA